MEQHCKGCHSAQVQVMKVSQRMAKFFVDLWKMESCFLQIRVKVMKVLTTEISSGISDQNSIL